MGLLKKGGEAFLWEERKVFVYLCNRILSGYNSKMEAGVKTHHGAGRRGAALCTEDEQMFVSFEIC